MGYVGRRSVSVLFVIGILFASFPAIAAQWYEDNPVYKDVSDGTGWTTGTPESQNVNSATLVKGVASLASDPDVYSVLLARHGVLIHESYYHGQSKESSANIHSASKSVVCASTCRAIQDGRIASWDTPICKILPNLFTKYKSTDARMKITVRDLAGMKSGLNWSEDDYEYDIETVKKDWAQQILDYGIARRATPGKTWKYSTGNIHLLSAVLQAATGQTTAQYTQTMILGPIGADYEHWGMDPYGISSGGYNCYLTARELASFAQLYLRNGKSPSGFHVLPEWAVSTCLKDYGNGYGLCWWAVKITTKKKPTVTWRGWRADGYGGQEAYVFPDKDIVFVTTGSTEGWNGEDESNHVGFVRDYLIPATK